MKYVHYENTDNVLDTVKPTRLLRRMLQIGTIPDEQNLILDFFAGSCSTAHAVLAQNREDGGNRRFICVQLPERLPKPESELKNLTDVAKQRMRNVITEMKNQADERLNLGEAGHSEDLGVKIFKLGSPNIQQWQPDADHDEEAYAQRLGLFNDPLVAGWKPENVIWEVALREGFGLRTHFAARELANGERIYDVHDPDSGQSFIVCLDEQIRADLSKHIELTAETIFICRDVALDDTAAANLALQCRLKTI